MSTLGKIWAWLSDEKNQKILAMLGGAVTTVLGAFWAFYLYVDKPEPVAKTTPQNPTTSIASITGNVTIQNTVNQIEKDAFVDQRTITYNITVSGPNALEQITKALTARQGIDQQTLQNSPEKTVPESVSRQIAVVMAAQKEAAAQGVRTTPKAAYYLGMLAAYKRDYDTALDYFRQAILGDPEYTDAFQGIAWLQQYRAMNDVNVSGDYDAAIKKLKEARDAAAHTDPLDAKALALRGFIYKTLAQLSDAKGSQADREKYYGEAARLFEHAAKLAPNDASAQNGLGNVQYARGNIDAAIKAYSRAIELAPTYAAAHHDLALALEAKMHADSAHAQKWCQDALQEWQKTYQLAPDDPGFSPEYILTIGQQITLLKQQCNRVRRGD